MSYLFRIVANLSHSKFAFDPTLKITSKRDSDTVEVTVKEDVEVLSMSVWKRELAGER